MKNENFDIISEYTKFQNVGLFLNKGNNEITEHGAILQRERQNS